MKYLSLLCPSVFLLIVSCALIPSGRLFAQQTAAAAAPAVSAKELDELTGPIALYPDEVVIQILTASRSYDTLKLFSGWLAQNANLKGSELEAAAKKFGFSDALVALAPFPQVVKMMVEKPDWTKALGQAVTEDKKGVGESIQRLRAQAQALGNLKTTPQQVVTVTNTVVEKTVEQKVVFVTNTVVQIQPANPQVIYVPTYPQTVYVQPAPPSYASAAGAALVGFTVGVIVADSWHHHYSYHEYWDDREDFYEDRQQNYQQNQDQRQQNYQENKDQRQGNSQERQTERQGNQDQRQNGGASAQSQGAQQRSGAPTAQWQGAQRQGAAPSAQPQGGQRQSAAPSAQRQPSAAPASSYAGGQTASRSSGMSSSGFSGYQSGSATRAQSSRGSSSMSASRGGGGRSGGGRR